MKKTDLEKFKELYSSFGIDCIVNEEDKEGNVFIQLGEDSYTDSQTTTNHKLGGYFGFYSIIRFDCNGQFLNQSFYE
jgi:hypothetical protein